MKYQLCSPISIVNFLTIFVKVFYDERFLSLLAFVLVLNGCDDGDLIQEDINFQDITTLHQNDIIFKLKKRSLLLEIPRSSL
jgi:uncharacterized membrane protein